MKWWIWYGRWWMVQYQAAGWVSFGIHIEPRKLRTGRSGIRYGPYFDLHIGCCIVSLGVNPYFSTAGSD